MTPNEYQKQALRTESNDFEGIRDRIKSILFIRLDHASKGLVTETGEYIDVLKRYEFYGKKIDLVNLAEELGDILWYVAIGCDALGVTLEEVMEKNIAKLRARFPEKFTQEKALNRDLDIERNVLEDSKASQPTDISDYLGNSLKYVDIEVAQSLKKIVTQLELCKFMTEDKIHDLEHNAAFGALKQLSMAHSIATKENDSHEAVS